MKKILQEKIYQTVKQLYPEAKVSADQIRVDYPAQQQYGDYACNIAMVLVRQLKKNPAVIAQEIADKMLQDPAVKGQFDDISVMNGFINFKLSDAYLQAVVDTINQQGGEYGNSEIGHGKKIHLDFVSANPTGPVHLGNGRGGPYGDSLANILAKAGYKPWREYYVNDYGNQVKVLGHSVLKDEEAQYKGEYIDELHKRIKKTDPFEAGQEAAAIIIEEMIKPSMEKMGIFFDEYFSEKSLHTSGQVDEIFKKLEAQGYIYEKEDALWFKATEFGDEKDRVIRKKTGEITYFGGDIAYHNNKFQRGNDLALDIWGADHHGDVKRVLGAAQALGYKGRLEIMLTQMLKVMKDGQEFKMSKRKGTYVSIDDLLEEVGKDAVRFFFLMYSNDTHMVFDLDLAKEKSDKNPVYYVQYAHARICSILRKARETGMGLENAFAGKDVIARLNHEKERHLMKHLNRFPELVEQIVADYGVHRLPYYAIELADKFHSFYHECKVLDAGDQELSQARLALVMSTKTVLEESLRLLGVSAPEKM